MVSVGQVTGSVVTIDHFGNLITNVDAVHLRGLHDAAVQIGGRELPVCWMYVDAWSLDHLVLVNSPFGGAGYCPGRAQRR